MRIIALSIAAILGTIVLGSSGSVAHAAPTKQEIKKEVAVKMVEIQPGDSLSKIATDQNSTVQRLYDANEKIENPNLIFPGEELRIPTADEELAARPMPVGAVVSPVSSTASAAAQPAVRSAAPRVAAAPVASRGVWDQLAQCEAGGNWAINTGNGYYGGLQFTISSWQAVGGSGLPSDASREEQIQRGEMLLAKQGWGAWPACTAKLGLR